MQDIEIAKFVVSAMVFGFMGSVLLAWGLYRQIKNQGSWYNFTISSDGTEAERMAGVYESEYPRFTVIDINPKGKILAMRGLIQ